MTVLTDVAQVVGIESDNSEFDLDLLTHINSAVMNLSQAGVVSAGTVVDSTTEWADVYSDSKFEGVKTYISLFVRRIFDPPQTSFTTTAIKESLDEIFWRLQEQARYDDTEK